VPALVVSVNGNNVEGLPADLVLKLIQNTEGRFEIAMSMMSIVMSCTS
jgi:hypothetical protein